MATPVYSTRFILHTANGTKNYTVPTGYRAVVKFVSCFNTSGFTDASVALNIAGPTVWSSVVQAGRAVAPGGLALVAYQGELVGVVNGSVDLRTIVCGYLLRDPSGQTGAEIGELPANPTFPRPAPVE